MQIYHNGQLLPVDQACISPFDASMQHAVGLFETMHAQGQAIFRLQAHVERLCRSAQILGLSNIPQADVLQQAAGQVVAANGHEASRVKLIVTPGQVNLRAAAEPGDTKGDEAAAPEPTVIATAEPAMQFDEDYFARGIMVTVAPQAVSGFDPLAGHKTLAYWSRMLRLRQAAQLGAGEVILLSLTNHLASGCISNLFLVKDGALFTPIARGEEAKGAIPSAVLPGITRQAILELAEQAGISCVKKMLTIDDLLEAEEVFLTNSGWQVLPVRAVEKKEIGGGKPGPVTKQLREAIMALICES